VNPPVIVWDAATTVLVVVVELGRQDHRLGLRLWLGASHATRVAALSSVPPGVGNRPPHKQPPSNVEERQAASGGLLAHDLHHLVNAFRLACFVAAPQVHLLLLCAALARWCWLNADTLQEAG
jgi:hypothetical protein